MLTDVERALAKLNGIDLERVPGRFMPCGVIAEYFWRAGHEPAAPENLQVYRLLCAVRGPAPES